MAERVTEITKGKIRDKPISADLRSLLTAVGNELNVYFEVTSGGQDPKGSGGKRTGSVRHDHGNAADTKAYVIENGTKRYLDFSKPADQAIWADIVRLSVAGGATGIGAGSSYMGNQTVHIGYGRPATWGTTKKGGPPPDKWLTAAYNLGKKTPPLNIPDVASASSVAPTPATRTNTAFSYANGSAPLTTQPRKADFSRIPGSPFFDSGLPGNVKGGQPITVEDFRAVDIGDMAGGFGALTGDKPFPMAPPANPIQVSGSATAAAGGSALASALAKLNAAKQARIQVANASATGAAGAAAGGGGSVTPAGPGAFFQSPGTPQQIADLYAGILPANKVNVSGSATGAAGASAPANGAAQVQPLVNVSGSASPAAGASAQTSGSATVAPPISVSGSAVGAAGAAGTANGSATVQKTGPHYLSFEPMSDRAGARIAAELGRPVITPSGRVYGDPASTGGVAVGTVRTATNGLEYQWGKTANGWGWQPAQTASSATISAPQVAPPPQRPNVSTGGSATGSAGVEANVGGTAAFLKPAPKISVSGSASTGSGTVAASAPKPAALTPTTGNMRGSLTMPVMSNGTVPKYVTKTVQVPNPAWVPPAGMSFTPTGGLVTQSQMDAIRAVPANSYQQPITPAVPQYISKEIQVLNPEWKQGASLGGSQSNALSYTPPPTTTIATGKTVPVGTTFSTGGYNYLVNSDGSITNTKTKKVTAGGSSSSGSSTANWTGSGSPFWPDSN